MKNTLILFGVILFQIFGTSITLILLYASPTEQAQVFEASITYLGTSILISSILFHISFEQEKDNLLRLIFIFLGAGLIFYSLVLLLTIIFASPDNFNHLNIPAIIIFSMSSLILLTTYIFMIKHNPKALINEK